MIGRLELTEKTAQLRFDAPAIARLGIPAYNWWNECLHGVARNGRATVFPQAINLAATWDVELARAVAEAISDEARAKHHAALRRGSHQQYQGLTFWTPNINIFRDPRWGRGQETWGEDVCLTAEMASAFMQGLQGADPKYLKTAACAKHFAVHSGPEAERHRFDACPPEEDFWDTYLPAFARLVKDGVEAVMPAYNRVYGEPCAGSTLLLHKILRGMWGFAGHVVSDCWAIADFHQTHQVTQYAEESAAMALKAGTDLNCGSVYCEALDDALAQKLVDEADVDRALRRLLRTRFKLGMFDPEADVPFAQIPLSVVNCPRHRALAHQAAADSFILLKNQDACLPIPATLESMLIVGPNAASLDPMLGNYYGLNGHVSTVVEGLMNRLPEGVKVDYRLGVPLDQANTNTLDWAVFEAVKCDYVVAAMGLSPLLEGEEGDALRSDHQGDRRQVELPVDQVDFIRRLRARIDRDQTGTKLIVLLFGGAPMAIPEIHDEADAVLQVGYPGEQGGDAIAAVLWGERVPGGKMPFTTPQSTACLPPFEDYAMRGRTYRFMAEADVLYPFGFGLGYSPVALSQLEAPAICDPAQGLACTVQLTNAGPHPVLEVVQAYLTASGSRAPRLVGFARVSLAPAAAETVPLQILPERLAHFRAEGQRVPFSGDYELWVGTAAPIPQSARLGAPSPLKAPLAFRP